MSDEAIEIPAIPDFNPKMVRRASRRGVARAALIAALIVGAVFAAVDFGSGAIARTHHPERSVDRGLVGATIAHPGYALQFGGWVKPGSGIDRTGGFTAVRQLQEIDAVGDPVGGPVSIKFHQSLFGSPSACCVVFPSKFENAINSPRPAKDATRHVIDGLPASSVASIAVELATPMPEDQVNALATRLGITPTAEPSHGAIFDSDLFTPMHAAESPGPDRLTVVDESKTRVIAVPPWFTFSEDGPQLSATQAATPPRPNATGGFRTYAASLKSSDSDMLIGVGLPPVNEIQAIAKDGKIYGFTVVGISPAQIAKVVDAAEVRSVAIADAQLSTSA